MYFVGHLRVVGAIYLFIFGHFTTKNRKYRFQKISAVKWQKSNGMDNSLKVYKLPVCEFLIILLENPGKRYILGKNLNCLKMELFRIQSCK